MCSSDLDQSEQDKACFDPCAEIAVEVRLGFDKGEPCDRQDGDGDGAKPGSSPGLGLGGVGGVGAHGLNIGEWVEGARRGWGARLNFHQVLTCVGNAVPVDETGIYHCSKHNN